MWNWRTQPRLLSPCLARFLIPLTAASILLTLCQRGRHTHWHESLRWMQTQAQWLKMKVIACWINIPVLKTTFSFWPHVFMLKFTLKQNSRGSLINNQRCQITSSSMCYCFSSFDTCWVQTESQNALANIRLTSHGSRGHSGFTSEISFIHLDNSL